MGGPKPLLRLVATMKARLPLCVLCAALFAPAAQAGLFEDEDARKAILDLRQRVDRSNEQVKAEVEQLRRSLLDLNNQLEALRADMAKLRGQNEQLARDVAEVQRQHKDLKQGIDERVSRIEPQKVTVEGKEFVAEPEERRLYEEAMATLRKGDFTAAASALAAFQKRYPKSGYADSVLFWLGNAQYGKRDYGAAITSFRALVAAAPDSPRAPEALLSLANCQIELKDGKSARKTLEDLLKAYPASEAAQVGRERLATLK